MFIFEILLHKSTPLVNGVVIQKMLKELPVEWGRVELLEKGLEILGSCVKSKCEMEIGVGGK